jgi:hypothetical protein
LWYKPGPLVIKKISLPPPPPPPHCVPLTLGCALTPLHAFSRTSVLNDRNTGSLRGRVLGRQAVGDATDRQHLLPHLVRGGFLLCSPRFFASVYLVRRVCPILTPQSDSTVLQIVFIMNMFFIPHTSVRRVCPILCVILTQSSADRLRRAHTFHRSCSHTRRCLPRTRMLHTHSSDAHEIHLLRTHLPPFPGRYRALTVNVVLPYPLEYAPNITVSVFDHDAVGKDDVMGHFRVRAAQRLSGGRHLCVSKFSNPLYSS